MQRGLETCSASLKLESLWGERVSALSTREGLNVSFSRAQSRDVVHSPLNAETLSVESAELCFLPHLAQRVAVDRAAYAWVSLVSVLATLLLTRFWLNNPDLVPRFPEAFWIWLIGVSGSQNGEDLASLELLVALFVSLILVMAITLLAVIVWRQIRR